ncbi:MAG: DUF3303 family protein [Proteobacteria bacterium]|nr:DUF3303 family protein [Pseudomonadota bacterium]
MAPQAEIRQPTPLIQKVPGRTLSYVASWVSADLGRCFQVMACEDVTLLQRWVAAWRDLATFEIVPVAEGALTRVAPESPA